MASPRRLSSPNLSKKSNRQKSTTNRDSQKQSITPSQRLSVKFSENEIAEVAKIFEGLTFLIEVFQEERTMSHLINPKILDNGGQVVKQLTPDTSYYIYENGRNQNLRKALQDHNYSNVKVVTPLWIQQSIVKGMLLDHKDYQLLNIEFQMLESSEQELENKMKIQDKKRQSPIKSNDEESKLISPIKSKRRMKASGQKNSNKKRQNQDPSHSVIASEILQDNKSVLFDREELDKTIRQIQDEKFFLKEFAKDVKKFSKLQGIEETEQSGINETKKAKRETKYMNKNQLIDSYIEGDIELVDFIEYMGPKLKDKKHGKTRKQDANTRRISEMFKTNGLKNDENEEVKCLNKTAIVSLQDFLIDIDKENTPPVQFNMLNSLNKSSINFNELNISQVQGHQTQLNFGKQRAFNDLQKPIFNHIPMNIFKDSHLQSNINRIFKSSTFTNQPKPQQNENENQFSLSDQKNLIRQALFPMNLGLRRARSMNPSKSHSATINFNDPANYNGFEEFMIDLKPNQTMMKHHFRLSKGVIHEMKQPKKRKDWEKILPQRKIPSRGCKLNVSYVEKEEDYIEKMINKRRQHFNY